MAKENKSDAVERLPANVGKDGFHAVPDFMKRLAIKSLLAGLTSWLAMLAPPTQAVSLRVGVVRGFPGNTVEVPVSLSYRSNEVRNVVALQADVLFATTGISDGTPSGGPLLSRHVLASSAPSPGVRRLLVYSAERALLTNGELARTHPVHGRHGAVQEFFTDPVERHSGARGRHAVARDESQWRGGREPGVRGAGWSCGWLSHGGVE